ncbi:MAG: hypothetical protein KDK27_05450 [Leptospiraceae bacterium]|nr:hypothetical protein [Leptospiraceae bacterium]
MNAFIGAYHDMRNYVYSSDTKDEKVYARSGNVTLMKSELQYANQAGRVLTPDEILELPEGARRLLLKKLLLRKIAISKGENEDIYGTPEAAAYLLPRIEQLLEEYYYHSAGDFAGIERETDRLKPGDAEIEEFLRTNPVAREENLSAEAVRQERDRIIQRLIRRRTAEARQKVIQDLLQEHPNMEVFP